MSQGRNLEEFFLNSINKNSFSLRKGVNYVSLIEFNKRDQNLSGPYFYIEYSNLDKMVLQIYLVSRRTLSKVYCIGMCTNCYPLETSYSSYSSN